MMTDYLWLISSAAGLALVIGAVALFFNLRSRKLLQKLFSETGHEEFGEVLLSHQRQLKRDQGGFKKINERLDYLETQSSLLLNQVGLVKYNPFPNSGGNMSFSLALLNDHGDGIVLTSLHSREGIRLYSKAISNYECDQQLMDEEREATLKAKRLK